MRALWITLAVSALVLTAPVISHAQSFTGSFTLNQQSDYSVFATTTLDGEFSTSTVCVGTQNDIGMFVNDLGFVLSNQDYDFSVYQENAGQPLYSLIIDDQASGACTGNTYAQAIIALNGSSTPYIEGQYDAYNPTASELTEAQTTFYHNASLVLIQIFYLLDFGLFVVALWGANKAYERYVLHKKRE